MNKFAMKLRILMRAEVTLFKAEAQRRTNVALLSGLSIACVLVALVFVNAGIFFSLTESDLDSRAAFILAGGNLAIALVPYFLSRQVRPGPEEEVVRDIREMAMDEISKDVDSISEEIAAVGATFQQVRSGVSAFGGGLPAVAPVLGMVIDVLKKKKK